MYLPKHEAGLTLNINPHKTNYETVERYLEGLYKEGDWLSPEDRQKSINTNELWELFWYPCTPVGCYDIMASSQEKLEELIKRIENNE